jgi:hypothetical protein
MRSEETSAAATGIHLLTARDARTSGGTLPLPRRFSFSRYSSESYADPAAPAGVMSASASALPLRSSPERHAPVVLHHAREAEDGVVHRHVDARRDQLHGE